MSYILTVVTGVATILTIVAAFFNVLNLRILQKIILFTAAACLATVAYLSSKGLIKKNTKKTNKKRLLMFILAMVGIAGLIITFTAFGQRQSVEGEPTQDAEQSIGLTTPIITPTTLPSNSIPIVTPKGEIASPKTTAKKFSQPIMEAYQVGLDYFREKDFDNAYKYFLKAAEAGLSRAQYYTGRCLLEGVRVDDEAATAADWFTAAAEQGDDEAQCELGKCYLNEIGVTRDYETAFFWFTESANQGNGNGYLLLGYCYHHGLGVDQNYELAYQNYVSAYNHGQTYAQKRLEELQHDMENGN